MKKLTALIAATALLGSTLVASAIFTPPTAGISNLQLTQEKAKEKAKMEKKDTKKKDTKKKDTKKKDKMEKK